MNAGVVYAIAYFSSASRFTGLQLDPHKRRRSCGGDIVKLPINRRSETVEAGRG